MNIDGTVMYYTSRYRDGPCYCFRHAVIRALIKSEEMYPWVEEPLGQDEYDMRSDPQCADCKEEVEREVKDHHDETKNAIYALAYGKRTRSLLEKLEELAKMEGVPVEHVQDELIIDLRRDKTDEHMEQKT